MATRQQFQRGIGSLKHINRWLLLLAAAGLLFIAAGPLLARADDLTPAGQVRAAWERARAAGRFSFETTTQQTAHPISHPANIGRRAYSQEFAVHGAVDRPANSVTIELWPNGRSSANKLTLKQENGRTVGRAGSDGEWTEVPEAADLFLQSSEPAAWLNAAENVRLLSDAGADSLFPSELLPQELEAAVTRYRFELDGPKYARYMRGLMEAELAQRGELPPGVSLGMVQEFVDMTGEGELWLDARGLPHRQILRVAFPASAGALEWTDAVITTDYSGWQPRLLDLAAIDWRSPRAALTMLGLNPTAAARDLVRLGYALLLLGLVALLFGRYSKQARAAVSLLIVASMLSGPFLQIAGAAAFTERQAGRAPAAKSESVAIEAEAEPHSAEFQPHRDPLATANLEPANSLPGLAAAAPPAAPPQAPVSPQRGAEAVACTVGESSDCDTDGLEDKVEVFELGTFADEKDSDGDGISDNLEVISTSSGGQTWYLDPRSPDSNKDGLPDGLECAARWNMNDDGSIDSGVTAATCPDTDGDGAPDIWDFDNDGDGVPDAVDSDPGSYLNASGQKVDLSLSGYQTGEPLFVEVAIRPANADHLWFANNYLDWPDLDQHGQLMRVSTETLGDEGDLMISALLEVTIPFSTSNPSRGLPVQDGVSAAGISATDPLEAWLDTDTLALYGISANMDDTGAMVLYAPLTMTRDIVGESPVALSTRLYYEMPASAGGWGNGHQMRLLWSVNGIADQCSLPEGETWASYCDVGSDRSNTTNLSHWTTTQTVFQTYYDDFLVTSLSVREEQNVDTAVIAQKQGASGASSHYENYLWHTAETLEETFMAAQLVSGQRMTVADIGANYSSWGIPAAALYFDELNVSNTTDMQDQLSGDNVITLLNQIYSGSSKPSRATLLFVGDRTYRSTGLDQSGSAVLSLSGVETITTGFMRWSPYSYDGTTWANLDLPSYLDHLGSDLVPIFTSGQVTNLGGASGYDVDDARDGAIKLAESFYASLYTGAITMLVEGGTVLSSETLDNSAHVLSGEPVINITAELLDMIQDYYTRISLSNLSLTATLFAEIEAVATSAWAALSSSRGLIMEALGRVVNGDLATSNTVALGQLRFAPLINSNLSQLLNAGALDYTYESTIGEAQAYGTGGQAAALAYYGGYRVIYRAYTAYRRFTGNAPTVSRLLSDFIESYETQLYIGYAIQVGEAIASFAYAWASGKITPGSPEFAEKLAYEIATIMVDTVLLIIAIVATGGIVLGILVLIGIIDGLAAIICAAVGVKPGSELDQWVCGGLTGALIKAITYVINDYTPLVDLTHSNRLGNNLSQPTLTQNTTTPGYAVGNTVNITAGITSTLYFGHPNWMGYAYAAEQLTDAQLKEASFRYELQQGQSDIDLDLNETTWNFIGGSGTFNGIPSGARYRQNFTAPVNYLLPAGDAGVNTGLSISLAEGFAMRAQDCWLALVEPVCGLETWRDTNQTDLSGDLIFDIFPQTIDGFRALALVDQDSYQLAWDETFPILVDADNDGVFSKFAGGADPDDSDPDSDGDGLNDGYELTYGFDPGTSDGDGDGLTDYWEAFYLTDPYEADSDGDGLSDSEEAFHPNWIYPYENSPQSNTDPPANAPSQSFYAGGWEIVYAFNGSTPLAIWVSASPRDADSDDDGIEDLREEVYGYNPLAASTLNVLSLKSQVSAVSGGDTLPVPFATLGSSLVYSATVQNELTDRWALGLLQTELPEDDVRATAELGVLQPLGTAGLSGSLPASGSGLSDSGVTSMTLRAGAIVEGDDDRVLWLRMNEAAAATTFTDSSVYDHGAYCTHCPVANGSYLNFSPTSSNAQRVLVKTTESEAMAATSFTLGMWVKVITPGAVDLYEFMTSSGGAEVNFSLGLNGSTVDVGVQGGDFATPVTVPTAEWTHLLVTYDQSSTQTTLYVNGIQQWQENTHTIVFGNVVFDVVVGAGSAGSHFEMDEVELFDRVLSTAEIEQLFGLPILDVDFKSKQDVSPSANTLSCTSGTNCPTVSSGAATFDQKSFLQAGGSALDFSGDRFTFAAWIKPQTRSHPFDNSAVGAYNSLTGAPPRKADHNYDWQGVFGSTSAGNTRSVAPSLYVNPAGQMRMAMGGGSGVCHVDTAEGLIDYGIWQHVIVSYDGSAFSFYVNGSKVAESSGACAAYTAGSVGTLQIGRASQLGTLYFNKVTFFDGNDDGSAFDIRINFDGDSASNNIWSGEAPDDTQDPFTINAAHYIPSDSSHSFRFWQDDKSPATEYQECTIGCDDSYVSEFVHNVDLGADSQTFDYNKGSDDFASGKLEWSISNDFFQGSINEFKAYKRTFSDQDALNLYEASYSGLYFSFDEPPGASSFADAYDSNIAGGCDYAGGSCPDSGIGGIANQAADFDGNDFLVLNQVDLLDDLTQDFTIAAWIRPENLSGLQRIFAAERTDSNNGFGFGINGGNLRFTTFGHKDYETGAAVVAGEWQHVAVVFDGPNNPFENRYTATFYVNGVLVDRIIDTVNIGQVGSTANSDDAYRIGSTTTTGGSAILESFKGKIDDLVIEARELSQGGVQKLMANAPLLNLHLDEDLHTTTFVDDSRLANDAACSGSACPGAGDKGQIREAAVFDGENTLTVPASADLSLSEFTVSLWVNPTEIKDDYQPLLVRENPSSGGRNYGIFIHPGTMDLHYGMNDSGCSTYKAVTAFNNPLLQHQWNHVVLTFDGSVQRLYINGTQRHTLSYSGTPCLTENAVYIGAAPSRFVPLSGSLDEVTIHGRAISAFEVGEQFAYQSAWFDVKETHRIVIDDDNPTVSLDRASPYLAPGETVMKINAQDPTSDIVRVVYGISGHTPGLPATNTNGVWTFAFDFANEGSYNVVLAAYDSVGNVAVTNETVYVDGQAPSGSAGSLPPHIPTDGILSWGNIFVDDNPRTEVGSGVDNSSVMVTVRDRLGNMVGAPAPLRYSRSDIYTAEIPFADDPYGIYSFTVSFKDNVGNMGSFTQPVLLESNGPHADVTLQATTTITPGMTLRGVASDVEHIWHSRGLHHHFEDGAGSTTFLDVSGNEFVAECASAATCPAVVTSGDFNDAVSFDGSDDVLLLVDNAAVAASTDISGSVQERMGLTNGSFTVMAWVNASSMAGFRPLLGTSPFEDYQELYIGFIGGAPAMSYGSHSVGSAETVAANEWHHVAWRYDMDKREQAILIDGVLVSTQANRDPYMGTEGTVTIGQADPTGLRFAGLVDELVVYNIPVEDARIYDIANEVPSGLSNVEVRFRHIDDQGQTEDSGLWHAATFTSGSSSHEFRTWQLVVPDGLNGSYKIDLRVTDQYGLEGVALNAAGHIPVPNNERFVPGAWTGTMGDPAGQPLRTVFLPFLPMTK